MKKLQKCVERKNLNASRAREAIYRLLLNADKCLNVSQILKRLDEEYPKKISQNTLYRHLSFFISSNLVIGIHDNYKTFYYYMNSEEVISFCVCTSCNSVEKIDLLDYTFSTKFNNAEFVTVHQECTECIKAKNNI